MQMLASTYPYPLAWEVGKRGKAKLQASGNQETVAARLQLPDFKYQAEIDIRPQTPLLTATNLVLGKGNFKISPIVGHHLQIRAAQFDLDAWLSALSPPAKNKFLLWHSSTHRVFQLQRESILMSMISPWRAWSGMMSTLPLSARILVGI
ncbi:possible exported protein [Vibrio ponticus]|nr:possible exported protein [Vibrio ponticus]